MPGWELRASPNNGSACASALELSAATNLFPTVSHKHGGKRPKAGRPRTGRISITIRVSPDVAALITRLAFLENQSLGEVVEERFSPGNVFTVR